jgi:hypothetical protein
MMREPTSSDPTNDAKRNLCLILSLGCDRQAAVKYVGWSFEELRGELLQDAAFAADVRRAEAASEMMHMRNIHNAAQDDKHWRASVWWLERRAPDRYGRRAAESVTPLQLESFLALIVSAVVEEVRATDDQERLLARLQHIADTLDESCGSRKRGPIRYRGDTMLAPGEHLDADADEATDGGESTSDDNSR